MNKAAIAVVRQDDTFLGIKRSQTVRAPGKICFPGGQVEDGESIDEAVVRELQEELGVTVKPVRHLWSSVSSWQVEIHWVFCELVSGAITCNQEEVEWYRWMTLEELRQTDLLPSNADFLDAIADGTITL